MNITSQRKFKRLSSLFAKQYNNTIQTTGTIPFALALKNGTTHNYGGETPAFTLTVSNGQGIAALSTMDQNTIIEAYLAGDIELEGDLMKVLALRELFNDKRGFHFLWRFIQPMLFGQVTSDKKWISNHYDTEAAFFLLFLDTRHRAYSQAVFESDSEPLEEAQTRKLNFAIDAVHAKAGDRVLDIGSGWGSFVEHAGLKGIQVTSLTISQRSQQFVQQIIDQQKLPCHVLLQHFFEHCPHQPYDAVVNCGVTEHLPDYAASLKHYDKLLKPGGYLYIDASADRQKSGHGTFMSKHVFEGNASLLCLHEFVAAVANSPFEIIGLWNDRHNYYLTTKEWAKRLDANRTTIENTWGSKLYKIFQLYLWGSAEGFSSGMIDAYRVVLQKM